MAMPSARKRPMATIIESLKELGAKVHDRGNGRLPFTIDATGELLGGEVTVDASKSSQFISGLLLSAARFDTGVTIHHVGDPIPSMPHIDMTVAMLAEHGVVVRRERESVWHVDPHNVEAFDRASSPTCPTPDRSSPLRWSAAAPSRSPTGPRTRPRRVTPCVACWSGWAPASCSPTRA